MLKLFLVGLIALLSLVSALSAAELHAIGIYAPRSGLLGRQQKDVADWPGWCAKLAKDGSQEAPSPARQVWKLLPPPVQAMVKNPSLITHITAKKIDRTEQVQRRKLGAAFDNVLKSGKLYDIEAFQNVVLSEEALSLVRRREELSRLETRWMNRLLLEAAFPKEIPHRADEIPETVVVKVTVTGQPIVLAISSYESARWQIEAAEGVEIEKVIVSGYHFQEVTGTKTPVSLHTFEDSPATEGAEPDYFHAWETETGDFETFETRLKSLTGLKLSTFQCQHQHDGKPFTVDARLGKR